MAALLDVPPNSLRWKPIAFSTPSSARVNCSRSLLLEENTVVTARFTTGLSSRTSSRAAPFNSSCTPSSVSWTTLGAVSPPAAVEPPAPLPSVADDSCPDPQPVPRDTAGRDTAARNNAGRTRACIPGSLSRSPGRRPSRKGSALFAQEDESWLQDHFVFDQIVGHAGIGDAELL